MPHLAQGQQDLGDLIFVYNFGGVHHVEIYAGNNAMWAAPHTGDVVKQLVVALGLLAVRLFGTGTASTARTGSREKAR